MGIQLVFQGTEYHILMVIGLSIILGFTAGYLFRLRDIPDIVGMIIVGIILGESFIGFLTLEIIDYLRPFIDLVLGFIGLGIGFELKLERMHGLRRQIVYILITHSIGAFLIVYIGVYLLTGDPLISIILSSIAISTAPAATAKVLWDYKASGELTTLIFAILALDDIIAIIIYSLAYSYVEGMVVGTSMAALEVLVYSLTHFMGSVFIGVMAGLAIIYLSRYVKSRMSLIWIIIIMVIAVTGLAETYELSSILSTVVAGIIIINLSRFDDELYDLIREGIYPLIILFFVLIGGKLRIDLFISMGLIGLIYFATRIIGKYFGVAIGGILSNSSDKVKRYLGLGLLTQGGLSIGLATAFYYSIYPLTIYTRYLATVILNTIIATTIIFEIIGPLLTKYIIFKAGEAARIHLDIYLDDGGGED